MAHKQRNFEKTITVVKYLTNGTCRYFTLFCTVMLVATVLSNKAVSPFRFLTLLPLAFFLCGANTLYRFTPWSAIVRHILHFAVCMIGVLLFELSRTTEETTIFVTMGCAALVYGLLLAVFLIVKHIRGRKKQNGPSYQSQFSDFQK